MVEDLAPLWVPHHDYMPPEDRSVIRALRPSQGVVSFDDFAVEATVPASWNVEVGPGRAIIDGSTNPWTQGSYIVYSPRPTTVPVEPSHPSQDRLDLVILHVYDQDNSTEQGYSWAREVVTGNPGTGLPPALPPNSMPLRGLNITRGSTAVRPENLISGPWWGHWDLRRPAGSVLSHIYDHKRFDNLGNNWYRVQYYDLQVPPAWRPLAAWQFDVVVETNITGEVYAHGGAAWTSYPCQIHWVGRTGGGYRATGVTPMTNQTAFFHIQDLQLWTAAQMAGGDMPGWELWIAPPPGTFVNTEIGATTKVMPRAVTTHRIWQQGLDW